MATTTQGGSEQGGIREIINKNPIPIGIGIVVLVAAVLFFTNRPTAGQGAYYSVDDGKTYFEDVPRIPPFAADGGEAVRAVVYSCDGGEKFVGYLVRWTPEGKPRAEAALKNGAPLSLAGAEVKRPGDATWTPYAEGNGYAGYGGDEPGAAPAARGAVTPQEIMDVRCPDGKPATAHNPEP